MRFKIAQLVSVLGPLAALVLLGASQANPQGADVLLPHEFEEKARLESQSEKGMDGERGLALREQEQAIQQTVREQREARGPEVQSGGRSSLKEVEARLRKELVPGLKAAGASDTGIEIMVRDLTRIMGGAQPLSAPLGPTPGK